MTLNEEQGTYVESGRVADTLNALEAQDTLPVVKRLRNDYSWPLGGSGAGK